VWRGEVRRERGREEVRRGGVLIARPVSRSDRIGQRVAATGGTLLVLFASFVFDLLSRVAISRARARAIRVVSVKLNRNRYRSLKTAIAFARRRRSFGSSSSPVRVHAYDRCGAADIRGSFSMAERR